MKTAALAVTQPEVPPPHRKRLLEAMSQAVAAKGYAAVTIADIAAGARVSKRTFYEHFDSKSACLLALHEAATGSALGAVRRALDPARDWHVQVNAALAAYFSTLSTHPALLHTLFIEIHGLGAEGLAARRRAVQAMADLIVDAVLGSARPAAAARRRIAPLATGLVGGIHELVLDAIEQGQADRLQDLADRAGPLVQAVGDAIEAVAGKTRD